MKQFLALVLISLAITQELYTLLVYTSFKLNESYIVGNLCVMKDIEENTCQGSCQIKRKLNFDDSNDETENTLIVPVNKYNCYNTEPLPDELTIPERELVDLKNNAFSPSLYVDEVVSSIFHPPKV